MNGIQRIGFMKGGQSAHWSDVDMVDFFLKEAQDFILEHKKEQFFLFYALPQPHIPRTPKPRFVGKSGMGPRGDVILKADWCVGELVKTLENEGIIENTIIIFSGDNGPVLNDGYYDEALEKLGQHTQRTIARSKYSLFEAGTRGWFFTYWKGNIKPMVSDAIVCQADLLNSLAQLANHQKTETDSQNLLNVFLANQT